MLMAMRPGSAAGTVNVAYRHGCSRGRQVHERRQAPLLDGRDEAPDPSIGAGVSSVGRRALSHLIQRSALLGIAAVS